MRCLHCHADGVSTNTIVCPECGIHIPTLMRDVLPPGTLLRGGAYRIDYALGRGGFGITYRAAHIALEQVVAIKEFFPQEHAMREDATGSLITATANAADYRRGVERFAREGKLLAKISHPNIIQVRDLFEERNTAYLVMEMIAGRTLQDELAAQPNRRLASDRVRTIVGPLIDALKIVHDAGIYHLDISPDNILLTDTGRVILIDFGAARHGFSSHSTQAFKIDYAPLEVLAREDVGPESDIFELGVMLHELLTGERPPNALARLRRDAWVPRDLPQEWIDCIGVALRLARGDRPSNIHHWWRPIAMSAVPPSTPDDAPVVTKYGQDAPHPAIQDIYPEQLGGILLLERREDAPSRPFWPNLQPLFTADNTHILMASMDGIVRMWCISDGSLQKTFAAASEEERHAIVDSNRWPLLLNYALSYDSKILVTVTGSIMRFWRVADGTLVTEVMNGSSENTVNIAAAAANPVMATITETQAGVWEDHPDGPISLYTYCVRLWDIASTVGSATTLGFADEQCLYSRKGLLFSPTGSVLATSRESVCLWRVSDQKILREISGGGHCLAFSKNGSMVATETGVWDVETGVQQCVLDMQGLPNVDSLRFAGQGIIVARAGKAIGRWRIEDCTLLGFLDERIWDEGPITGAGEANPFDISPDGETIVTCSSSNKVRLWSAQDGRLLHDIATIEERALDHWVSFSPNGQMIAALSVRSVGSVSRAYEIIAEGDLQDYMCLRVWHV